MINAGAKGSRVEKKCYDALIAEGYTQNKIKLLKKRGGRQVLAPISLIWKTIRGKWLDIDLFGLFDVVALHPKGEHIRFIQCKTNRADNKARQAIMQLKMPPGCIKEMWIWMDNVGWRKEYYD